jgi:hypothetical protein
MTRGDVQTYHQHGLWRIKIEGDDAEFGSYYTRDQAIAVGRQLARERKVEHIVKRVDGALGEHRSYREGP